MVVSASLVSYQRPFSCHPSSPLLVIPVLDTGSPYDGVIQVASIQVPLWCHPSS